MEVNVAGWKWIVPGCTAFLLLSAVFSGQFGEAGNLAVGGCALVMFLQACSMYISYFRFVNAVTFETKRRAEAVTSLIVLAEHLKSLNPVALDLLAWYGRPSWEIIPGAGPSDDDVVYTLTGKQVTSSFIVDFLKKSKFGVASASQYGSAKHFAPGRLKSSWCSDASQYEQFVEFLISIGRVTRAYGRLEWIKPWNAENVARSFGIWVDETALSDGIAEQNIEKEN